MGPAAHHRASEAPSPGTGSLYRDEQLAFLALLPRRAILPRMSLPPLTIVNVLLAAAPLLLVLFLMIARNWGGSKAGLAGWFAAALIAMLVFGADLQLLVVALGRGLLLALYVLYIIWMALLLYHVVNDAGAIKVLGQELPGLAPDRAGQALLLAWVFGSFLQGASGFGVPAAVIAPLLVGLHFPPNVAVAVALLGHGWAVSFGSLGSSYLALIAATGLPGEFMASESALFLAVACLGCGLGVLLTAGGLRALRERWLFLVLVAVVMSAAQWVLAVAGLWTLAALGGGMAGLGAAAVLLRRNRRTNHEAPGTALNLPRLGAAFAPYLFLVLIIVAGQLLLAGPLDVVELNMNFPTVETSFGWRTDAGPGRSISLFGHAGALLLYASAAAFLWFRWRGVLKEDGPYEVGAIVHKTVKGSVKSTISIIALVAMALTMQHAGMTQMLAVTLSENTGTLFPFLSPFIGALGAFVTGSNTNSNVIFGQLQQQTALTLGVSVPIILAAQTAGGALGSVFAPAKVVVGVSTVSGADEGQVLKLATAYGVGLLVVLGVAAMVVG